MAGLKFSPTPVIVRKGTTVTFDNNDVVPHTVTQDGPTVPGGVDSGLLGPGKSYQLVMNAPLAYHCTIHPFMQASVELEG
jgi:plastocyanin